MEHAEITNICDTHILNTLPNAIKDHLDNCQRIKDLEQKLKRIEKVEYGLSIDFTPLIICTTIGIIAYFLGI
jgi:hypothetical protein